MPSPTETAKELGRAIRAGRKTGKLTQAQLAGLCNYGRRFVIDVEAGRPQTTLLGVLTLARAVGVNIKIERPH
jgi:transcriptional regulator with XRE-family HTH domain